jgi:uncharacterized protein
VQSALKNEAIELRKPAEELGETEIQAVLKRLVKQRKDSITQYEAGGRADLAENEQKELDIISAYLPAELDEASLETLVKEALASAGFSSKQDMGKAMGAAMSAVAGQASGDRVKSVVQNILT